MTQALTISILVMKEESQVRLSHFSLGLELPWAGARQGKIGDGQVGVTSYVVPKGAFPFWEQRLQAFQIPYQKVERFGETYIQFDDPHGLHLELVEREAGEVNAWTFGGITSEVAIKGFGGATLYSARPTQTAEALEKVMGFERVGEEGEWIRFRSSADIGNIIDLKNTSSERGSMGVGTVHHLAFRAIDDQDQLEWQEYVSGHGYGVTAVRDRCGTGIILMPYTFGSMEKSFLKLQQILLVLLMTNLKKQWESN